MLCLVNAKRYWRHMYVLSIVLLQNSYHMNSLYYYDNNTSFTYWYTSLIFCHIINISTQSFVITTKFNSDHHQHSTRYRMNLYINYHKYTLIQPGSSPSSLGSYAFHCSKLPWCSQNCTHWCLNNTSSLPYKTFLSHFNSKYMVWDSKNSIIFQPSVSKLSHYHTITLNFLWHAIEKTKLLDSVTSLDLLLSSLELILFDPPNISTLEWLFTLLWKNVKSAFYQLSNISVNHDWWSWLPH